MTVTTNYGPGAKPRSEWFGHGRTSDANAKAYAREHGAAFVWNADASGVLFYMDSGRLRQKTFTRCNLRVIAREA